MNVDQAVALAYRQWELGQSAQAEQLCRQALAAWPGRADALHLLGLMAHRFGNLDTAIGYLTQACAAPGTPALYFSNLAEMHRQRGNLLPAETAARRATLRDPALAQAWNNLGIILQEAGKFEDSLAALERAAALTQNNPELHNNLGNTLARLGALDQAWGHYTQALALNPNYAEAHSNLASVLQLLGRPAEALPHAERAIALNPHLADAHLNAASLHFALGAHDPALQTLEALLAFSPDHPRALQLYAQVLDAAGHGAEAIALAQRVTRQNPQDGEAQLTLAKLLQARHQPAEAAAAVARAAALSREPAEALAVQASFAMEAGDLPAALAAVQAALRQNPRLASAWLTFSELHKFPRGAPEIAAMEALLGPAGLQGNTEQICLHFALGKAYLDTGQPERAFAHFATGNRMKRAEFTFDAPRIAAWMAEIAATFTPETLRRAAGRAGEGAVFIIGMPRSGTTLVEQILSAHPAMFGAGELNFAQAMVDDLTAETGKPYPAFIPMVSQDQLRAAGEAYLEKTRELSAAPVILDKMPSNFLHLGLLHLALPAARFIHIRRNAADTCLSCYTKLFAGPQAFAYDLTELGAFHGTYAKLMDHWRAVLPNFIEVDYESLVTSLEPESRRLVAFCGLDWDPACLDFQNSTRIVRTASAAQVRQPLYPSSIGRAERYAAFLAPLFEALQCA